MIREVSRRENVKVSAPVLPVEHPVDRTGAPAASVMSPLPQDDLKEVRRQLEYRLSLYGKLVQRIRMALDRNNVKKAREEIRVFMTTPIKPLPPVPEPEPPRPLLTQPDAIDVVDPSAETIVEPIPDLELGDADPLLDPENGVDAEDIVPDDVPERADSE